MLAFAAPAFSLLPLLHSSLLRCAALLLLLLLACPADPEQRGNCHVQTAQLDGETNLKMRNALRATAERFTDDASIAAFRGRLVCREPDEHFDKFSGLLYLTADTGSAAAAGGAADAKAAAQPLPLDAKMTLLRGCVLKNVHYVYGVVVYTGRETKVRVKQSAVFTKKASVEAEINRYIVALIALQILICLIATIGYGVWTTKFGPQSWYLDLADGVTAGDVIARFFTMFLLVSNIIPISLYVTMKLARTAQKFFQDRDVTMEYIDTELAERTDGKEGIFPLRVRSLDLNDELGQISHIFSDKTGTLTSNYMEFRKLTINGVVYGRGSTEIGMARRRRLKMDTTELEKLARDAKAHEAAHGRETPHVNFIAGSETHPGRDLRGPAGDLFGSGAASDASQGDACRLMFLNLCLNHTVVLEKVPDKHRPGEFRQQLSASSPDEEAFVLAGRHFGFDMVARQKDTITLRINGVDRLFRTVEILAYSSARQMMSVIVEDLAPTDPSRRFMLFAKGSDARIFNLSATKTDPNGSATGVSADVLAQQRALIEVTKAQLIEMAEDGLRTLCFAWRPVPESELTPWLARYSAACADLKEKKAKVRETDRQSRRAGRNACSLCGVPACFCFPSCPAPSLLFNIASHLNISLSFACLHTCPPRPRPYPCPVRAPAGEQGAQPHRLHG